MRRRFQALAGLAVLSVVALLAPTSAGAVGEVATTTAASEGAAGGGYGGARNLFASVTAEDGSVPTGTVVFSIGGVEAGRATLANKSASLLVDTAVGPNQAVTVDYLGDADHLPSQGTTTLRPPAAFTGWPATASVQFGSATATIDPTIPFLNNPPTSSAATGTMQPVYLNNAPMSLAAEVPGHGPVTIDLAFDAAVLALTGTIGPDGSFAGDFTPRIKVARITEGGTTWSATCILTPPPGSATGTVVDGHLSLTATAPAYSPLNLASTACGGRGDLVNAVLAQPISVTLETDGTLPLPVPTNTATTTTVTATPDPLDGRSSLTVTAAVAGPTAPVTSGTVRIDVSGGYTARATLTASGGGQVARTFFGPFPDGPVEVTATYLGTGVPYLESSGTATVERSAPPAGSPASGAVTFQSGEAYVLPAGSVLQGGAFDPATGVIADASLVTPRGTGSVDTGIIGTVQTVFQIGQTVPVDGLVGTDGSVTLGPLSLTIDTLAYRQFADESGASLVPCVKMVTATFTGTADGDGLHLSAADVPLPPFPPGSCLGLSSTIDGVLGSSVDLAVEVAGDYRRDVEETSTSVTSWFSEVAQHNHGLFSAKVTSATAATGEVTFFDGTTELGSVPVASDGTALLAAPLDVVGPRTITARYSGDGSHVGSEGSTTVTVTPPPAGLSVGGSLQVGSVSIPIGEGSVLEPQGSASSGAGAVVAAVSSTGAQLSFQPVSVPMVLPGYGPATVEVRLVQNGRLTTAAVGSDGRFGGLAGAFALHVRKVTLAGGQSVTPLGCASVVLLVLDGQLQVVNATLGTQAGGSGAYRNSLCTGPGKAATNLLTGRTVTLAATISY